MSDDGDNKPPPVSALQDLIAGGIAGSASVLVGHPFDTYKVQLQVSKVGTKPTITSLGTLYRGLTAPLSMAAVVNAIIFSSYGESSRLYDEFFSSTRARNLDGAGATKNNNSGDESLKDHSSPLKSFICGSIAGSVQAVVICPSEHIKCRLQTQHTAGYTDIKYKGSFDALDKILNSHGVRGLYRGFACTAWREVPAFGLYFSTYSIIKDTANNLIAPNTSDQKKDDGNNLRFWLSSSLAGGISGAFTWLVIYHFDVIKTRIQTSPLNTPIEKRRMHYIARQILNEHGWKYFFRGLGVTLLRAFPVNAIIFPTYEFTLMQLTEYGIGTPALNENAI